MRTVSIITYKFDELSDKAKERARAWWREASGDDWSWSEQVIEDFIAIAALLGVEIATYQQGYYTLGGKQLKHREQPSVYFSGFWSQGDGACFEGTYEHVENVVEKLVDYAPQDAELKRIAEGLAALQAKHANTLTATITHRGNYYHAYMMQIEAEADVYEPDNTLQELMRDLANWLYRTLEAEYEYQNADEQVDEAIDANGYDFTEDGKRCHCL